MTTPLGTQENPIRTREPMKVARAALREVFNEGGEQSIYEVHGDFFIWYGGKWLMRDPDWVNTALWRFLEDAWWEGDGGATGRFSPTSAKVNDVMQALKARARLFDVSPPMWLKASGKPDADRLVAFEDVIVDISTGDTIPRDRNWFDVTVMPCEYQEDAECPKWMQSLEEWSQGDEDWVKLLQRWFGYCLMPHCEYAKWFLMEGKARAGKGTITRILRAIIGRTGFLGTDLDAISDKHGMQGTEYARVISLSEASELESRLAERAARVMKSTLGRDPQTINPKNKAVIHNVIINAKLMMQSNEIPKLPNKNRGLSTKMLVLPFTVSYEGRENHHLESELMKELPGIIMWALQGAYDIEEASVEDRWPEPKAAADIIRMYHLVNNPMDAFLQARFLQRTTGQVATSVIRREWKDFIKSNKIKIHIPDNMVVARIVEGASWPLERKRGSRGTRYVRGLSLARNPDDEV